MIRSESYRFRILRNGADYAEIFPTSAPTLRMSSDGEIKISLQGTFLADAVDGFGKTAEVNWLSDEIKPVMVLDGVEYSLGILMPSTVTPSRDATDKTLGIQAYDRCWRVKDMKVEGGIHLNAGLPYLDAVEGLLISSGVTAVNEVDSDAVLAEAREDWNSGTAYLEIVNDLLMEINYQSLWFNENGVAMLRPILTPSVSNIKHTFTSKKVDKRISQEAQIISITPEIKRTMDVFNAPNVFSCVCANPDKTSVMVARSVNDNPRSPLSVTRRGRRIVQVVTVNNIASQTELQNYADILRNQSMYTGETITIRTVNLPGFGVNDIVAINDEDVFDICEEKAWEMQLETGGMMTHTLYRTVVNMDG